MKKILISGGAGFAGSNLARYFIERGDRVDIIDNLSRPGGGSKRNLESLREKYHVSCFTTSIVDYDVTEGIIQHCEPDVIVHCAAQTSLRRILGNPYPDFTTNALGTLNCLEIAKKLGCRLVYFSTNKVYGSLENLPTTELDKRFDCPDVAEDMPVIPHLDPYSLSKTIGDQYAQLYPKTTVLRFSSLYGPGQWAISGQGWLGVMGILVAQKQKILVSGNGKQVRDILHAGDLCDLIGAVVDKEVYGVFNAGGGRDNSWSMLEYFDLLVGLGLEYPKLEFEPWHTWTEKCYITDTGKIRKVTGWKPSRGQKELEEYVTQWLLPEVLPHGFTL